MFARRMAELLEEPGAVHSLAATLHVTEGALWHYAGGRREPKPDMLRSIAEAAGVSADWLIGLERPTGAGQDLPRRYPAQMEGKLDRVLKLPDHAKALLDSFVEWLLHNFETGSPEATGSTPRPPGTTYTPAPR